MCNSGNGGVAAGLIIGLIAASIATYISTGTCQILFSNKLGTRIGVFGVYAPGNFNFNNLGAIVHANNNSNSNNFASHSILSDDLINFNTSGNGGNAAANQHILPYCTRYEASNGQRTIRRGDQPLHSARICAVITQIVSAIALFVSWGLCCCTWNSFMKGLAILLLASCTQGLTFLITRSKLCSSGCALAWGGGLSIFACVMYFWLAILVTQLRTRSSFTKENATVITTTTTTNPTYQ